MEKNTAPRTIIDRLQFWKKPVSPEEATEAKEQFTRQRTAFWITAGIYLTYAIFERVSRPEEKHWVLLVLGWLVLLYCLGESFSWFWRVQDRRYRFAILGLLFFIVFCMLAPGPVSWGLRQIALTKVTDAEAVQVMCGKGGTTKSLVQLWDFQLNYSVKGTRYQKYFSNLYNCPGKDKPVIVRVSNLWPAIMEIDPGKTARHDLLDNGGHDQP